ncbi:hypothetical protein FRC17_006305 [Serendipita sp. 399]|nr:hypothetical protein FRC17_006305 [Serendipita sp. 399]
MSEVKIASDLKAGKLTNETESADAEVPPTPVSVALEEAPATTVSEEVLEKGSNLGDAREESQTIETAAISNAEPELTIGPFEEARIEVTEPTPSEPPDKDSIFNPLELKPQQLSHAADIVYVETPAGSDHSAPLGIPGAKRSDYLSSGSSFDIVGVATGSEPPQIVSSVPKDGHLIPIVIKETNDDAEGRPEVQRLLSTTPEAPTSPRDELEDTSHIATPIITPVRIQESVPYTAPDTTQETVPVDQSVPTVAVTAPKDGLDFVDDARSDRSVGTSVAPIAPNSPRFITPLPTPSMDSTEFSLYQANGSTIDGPTQPLTESAVDKLPESMDPVAELAPELKEALDSTVIEKAPLRALDESDGETRHTQLEPVTEDGMTSATQHSTMRSSRPRHSSSPSTWSINRSSGWFHPGANIPGRPSLEIVEGEFSRPQPRSASAAYPAAYPPDAVSPGTGKAKDDERCVIF